MINETSLIICITSIIGIISLISLVLGQHSVWKYLRTKGQVKIGKWCYTAINTEKKKEDNLL